MASPTVTTTGLRKRFGATAALDGVDVDFGPGVNGLLGPNGAGKTTMLRILATVLPADDGRVEVLGDDPATAAGRLDVRRRLGYLPQEPGFHRHFTAFEFIEYVAILKEWADRKPRHDEVRRVLGLVGLDAVMHKRIGQLSGGMRRRVGMATPQDLLSPTVTRRFIVGWTAMLPKCGAVVGLPDRETSASCPTPAPPTTPGLPIISRHSANDVPTKPNQPVNSVHPTTQSTNIVTHENKVLIKMELGSAQGPVARRSAAGSPDILQFLAARYRTAQPDC